MRHISPPDDPSQNRLFDIESCGWWVTQLTPAALRHLENGIEGFIRRSILKLMPAEEIGESFNPEIGRLSKELYAICGLLLLAEFYNWTIEQAARAWCFDASVQFALKLPRDHQYLCPRTLDSYRKLMRQDERAQKIFEEVTAEIVRQLQLSIRKQRLDSTHIFSDMAQFGRLKLLAVTVKRFLVQLKRHEPKSYAALPQELKERYTNSESRLFGMGSKKRGSYVESIAEVAEDIGFLVARFEKEEAIAGRSSFKALSRVFCEHCEVKESKITVKPKACDEKGQSSRVLQNPSDVDAGYDGHKGPGYQIQIAQAYDTEEDAPGIITACVPQSAAVSDAASLKPVYEQQTRMGTMPEVLLADTGYGSQAHADMSAEKGVKFYSPVAGKAAAAKDDAACSESGTSKDKKARLNARRLEQETEEWKSEYRKRSGLEGLHSGLDRTTGVKHLRVRGEPAVDMSVYLKLTGWNIRTATVIMYKMRAQKRVFEKFWP